MSWTRPEPLELRIYFRDRGWRWRLADTDAVELWKREERAGILSGEQIRAILEHHLWGSVILAETTLRMAGPEALAEPEPASPLPRPRSEPMSKISAELRARRRAGRRRRTLLGMILLTATALAGCAGTAPLRPEPVSIELGHVSWPEPTEIVVLDAREDRTASDALRGAITAALGSAIQARPGLCPCQTLTVTIFRHDALFPGGGSPYWLGHTQLGAVLRDPFGTYLNEWNAEDREEQWNLWGYDSGRQAAQQSLQGALGTLLRKIGGS